MLLDTEISSGDIRRLTPEGQLALSNLVRRSSEFRSKSEFYGDVRAVVKAVCDAAHVPEVIAQGLATASLADAAALTAGATPEDLALAKSLAAVCAKLADIPGIVVESHGSEKNQRFLSAAQNWEELAGDVILSLYSTTLPTAQLFGVVARLCNSYGVAWATPDELYFTVGRRRLYLGSGY
jgi:hypothetical protein